MTVIVQTGSLGLSKGQHRTVFRNPRGNKYYYTLYVTDDVGLGAFLQYEYSNDGVDWSNAPSGSIPFTGEGGSEIHSFDIKITEDAGGSQLVIWGVAIGYEQTAGAHQTKYVRGTIADAGNTITWGAAQVIDADINDEGMGDPHCIALARTDNGEIVVAFTEDFRDMGKTYRLTNMIGSDGDGATPNWTDEWIIADPSQNSNNQDKSEVWSAMEAFSSDFPERVAFLMRFPHESDSYDYEMGEVIVEWDSVGGFFTLDGGNFGSPDPNTGVVLSLLIDDNDCVNYLYSTPTSLSIRQGGQPGEIPTVGIIVTSSICDACCLSFDGNPPESVPSTDEVSGSWTPSAGNDLYAMVDDGYTDDDSTYIENAASDACRLGGMVSGDEVEVCIRAALTGAAGATMRVETLKDGVAVQTLVIAEPLSATIKNYAFPIGLNKGDFDEIQITPTLNASDSVRVYNTFVDFRRVYATYHDSTDTVDWECRTVPPKKTNSITMSFALTTSYHQDITALSCWNRQVENSIHIAGMHGTNVVYNEHPVYKALSTTLADLEFPDQNYYLGPHST
jgi:hypothetical protein